MAPERADGVRPVAVVTGASQGIGRAIAERLVSDGYLVWAVARRREVLDQLASAAPALIPGECDLTDPGQVDRLTAAIASRTPRLLAVVHCAGTLVHGAVASASVDDLRAQFVDNVEAAYLLTQRLLAQLVSGSTVVFLNSSQGLRVGAGAGHYAASMHARKAIADALRLEVNERGIRVTSIYPGRTASPRQADIYARHDWEYRPELLLQPADIAEAVATILRLPNTAEVTDLSIRPALKSY